MKLLIIARHGEYNGKDGRLNEKGQRQVTKLAEKLASFVNGSTLRILTSTASRAMESAEILGAHFKNTPEQHHLLWSDNDRREDLYGALELVRAHIGRVDALILVTHFEYTTSFPTYFCAKELSTLLTLTHEIKRGEACVINCTAKTLMHVRH